MPRRIWRGLARMISAKCRRMRWLWPWPTSWGRGWIGFFSGVLDVSLVTLSLWLFLRLDRPLDAVPEHRHRHPTAVAWVGLGIELIQVAKAIEIITAFPGVIPKLPAVGQHMGMNH